ncbi:GNAT family N-acetyltransferase [Demequina capsici]|uniref:GNAT family protein n=1 Tax=Demequina capsici TaxID=3075620 RepID=A0AA96JB42_9MICO|nr:GNAT family protein [Demequina sp. OYTSA14]WNM25381.1 GNAT family protein [Demequina sp. OYTSA14]
MSSIPADLGGGLVLRQVEGGDARPLSAALRRNRDHLAPWNPERGDGFSTEAGQAELIGRLLGDAGAGTCLPLVIVSGSDVVGALTVSQIYHGPFQSGNVGYWIDRELEGRGIMTRVLGAVVEHVSTELGLHRLQAATLLSNRRSQDVLERNGFTRIGVAERYLQIAGRWQDHLLFQRIME